MTGLLGGFTTFSSFGWEMLDLMQGGRVVTAMVYAALSVGIGLLCAWAGHALGLSLSAGS